MTIVVTGGLGYLGSALVRELPTHPDFADETILILDSNRRHRLHTLETLPEAGTYAFTEADVRDTAEIAPLLEGADTVFHLAARTNAQASCETPAETHAINHRAAVDLFEAAQRANVDTFVFTSTCSVYEGTDDLATETDDIATETDDLDPETDNLDPETPYAKAKLAAERDIKERHDGALELVIPRLGTVHGWSPGVRYDLLPNQFAYRLATGQPIEVYRQRDETRIRPFVHVSDAVRALIYGATNRDVSGVFNVVDRNVPMDEIVEELERQFDPELVENVYPDSHQFRSYRAEGSRLRDAGFSFSKSIEDGIRDVAGTFERID